MFPVTFANEHWVSRGSGCLTVTVFFLGGGGGEDRPLILT